MAKNNASIVILDDIVSTNLHAMENFHSLPNMSAIFAEKQSGGRGRQARIWHSPPGNIYASFVLKKISYPPPCAAFATCLAGLATLKTLAPQFNFQIKLPNDIICENHKIGGVLCEIRRNKDEVGLVAGIGLNINAHMKDIKQPGMKATSIFNLLGHRSDIAHVRLILVKNAIKYFKMDEAKIISEFVSNCILIGRVVTVKDAFGELKGKLKTILSDGAAVIETSDTTHRKFYSGDFVLS